MKPHAPRHHALGATIALSLILGACGGSDGGSTGSGVGSDTGDDGGGSGMNGGTIGTSTDDPGPAPVLSITVSPGGGAVPGATAFSPDGDRLAIVYFDASDRETTGFIHDVATGEVVATLAGLDELVGFFGTQTGIDDLYWAADGTLTGFGGGLNDWLTWDGTTGALVRTTRPMPGDDPEDCRTAGGAEDFDPVANRLYVAPPFGEAGRLCRFDLGRSTIASIDFADAPGPTESLVFADGGETLWISFLEQGTLFTPAGSRSHDAETLLAIGDVVFPDEGTLLGVGSNYRLTAGDGVRLALEPGGELELVSNNDVIVSSNGSVVLSDSTTSDSAAIVSLAANSALFIGTTAPDAPRSRSLSRDGSRAATRAEEADVVTILDLSRPTAIFAFVPPPEPLPGRLDGAVIIDGISRDASGGCQVLIEEGLGTNIVDVRADLSDGSTLVVRGQNLLGSIRYFLTIDGDEYLTDRSPLAAREDFDFVEPSLASDGATITGTATVYRFDSEFGILGDPVTVPGDPTSPLGIELELSLSCAG